MLEMPDGACWQHVALCLVGESGLSIPELGHENFDPEGAENQGWRVCAGADVPAGAIQGAFCGLEWTAAGARVGAGEAARSL